MREHIDIQQEYGKAIVRQMQLEGDLRKNEENVTKEEYVSEAVESTVRGTSITRAGILETAKTCVCGQREEDYGSPEDNFQLIANLWELYLCACGYEETRSLYAKDVANMMILLKVARNAGGSKLDNWIDIAGYAACGGEIEFG